MLDKILQIKDQKKMMKAMEKWHEERKDALNSLAQHEHFDVLQEYWDIEYKRIDEQIDSLKGEELERAVIERKIVKRYQNWVRTLTT